MDFNVDQYRVLGLPSGKEGTNLTEKEISKAYRALAHANFQRLKLSYDILKDQSTRKWFNDHLLDSRENSHIIRDTMPSKRQDNNQLPQCPKLEMNRALGFCEEQSSSGAAIGNLNLNTIIRNTEPRQKVLPLISYQLSASRRAKTREELHMDILQNVEKQSRRWQREKKAPDIGAKEQRAAKDREEYHRIALALLFLCVFFALVCAISSHFQRHAMR